MSPCRATHSATSSPPSIRPASEMGHRRRTKARRSAPRSRIAGGRSSRPHRVRR
jgi:hypothetical protein